jgi:circadian clock protein KaiC
MSDNTVMKTPSGTPGLDTILHDGVPDGHATIVTGEPGTGKSVLALQFLSEGQSGLYIGFEEREKELRRNATGLDIDLSDVEVLDLSPSGEKFFTDGSYTVFPAEEVAGEDLLNTITSRLETSEIDRLVIDPLSELRSLLPDNFQFRQKVTALFNALTDREVTTLCTVQPDSDDSGVNLQFLGNTIIELHRSTHQRTLEVTKYRGSNFQNGVHTYRIHDGEGGRVYPKLIPDGQKYKNLDRTQLPADVSGLDTLLHGGIERGSVTIVSGPSGVGKTTTGSHFLQAAARRGERGMACLFEELRPDYLDRSTDLGMEIEQLSQTGDIEVEEIEALRQSPDEFAAHVTTSVAERGVEFVMIDGTVGYRQGLRGDASRDELTRELHSLCRYLKRRGVTVLLIEEVQGVTGEFTPTNHEISYLADNIIFLRHLEAGGEIEKAIGVLKKRYGEFNNALHALTIEPDRGVVIGEPLSAYQNLLTGIAEPIDTKHNQDM